MVSVDGDIIEIGCQVFYENRHCMTVTRYGGIVNLLMVLIVVNIVEGKTAVLFAHEFTFSISQFVHRRNGPKCSIAFVNLVEVLHVYIGREAFNS